MSVKPTSNLWLKYILKNVGLADNFCAANKQQQTFYKIEQYSIKNEQLMTWILNTVNTASL